MTSRFGLVTLDWADGTHDFRLGLAEIEEIEAKFDRSLFVIAGALGARTAKVSEIREVVRVGLIGGGMKPVDALAKVRRYLDERAIEESRDVAYAIVLAGLMRVNTDAPQGEAEAPETSPGGSTSGPSAEARS